MAASTVVATNPRIVKLGPETIDYAAWLELQSAVVASRKAGAVDDTIYVLEHPPVITIGRSAQGHQYLKTSREVLISRGINVIDVDRGGDITYHAPGQVVVYPIVDLDTHGRDLHAYIRGIESSIIDVLGDLGVVGSAIPGMTGVWVGDAKIAAIGIKVSRWVTSHGFSVNNTVDLAPMRDDIVACGLVGKDVTSLAELGIEVSPEELEDRLTQSLCRFLGIKAEIVHTTVQNELTMVKQ